MITFRIANRLNICLELMKKYNRLDLKYLLEKYPEWNTRLCCAMWHSSTHNDIHYEIPIELFNLLSGYKEKHDEYSIKKYHSFDTAMIYYTKALKKFVKKS